MDKAIHSDEYLWSPLTLSETKNLFRKLPVSWRIAGGVALDLLAGHQIRRHNDIDVGIFRDDQLIVQQHLSDWDLNKINQPGLAPWSEGEYLMLGVNQVWCRRAQYFPWSLEMMFIERDGDELAVQRLGDYFPRWSYVD